MCLILILMWKRLPHFFFNFYSCLIYLTREISFLKLELCISLPRSFGMLVWRISMFTHALSLGILQLIPSRTYFSLSHPHQSYGHPGLQPPLKGHTQIHWEGKFTAWNEPVGEMYKIWRHFCWRSPHARLADIATKVNKDNWQQHCTTPHVLPSLALVTLSISPSKYQTCLEGFWLKVWCGARESVFLASCWILLFYL